MLYTCSGNGGAIREVCSRRTGLPGHSTWRDMQMTLAQIATLLDATVHCGEQMLDTEVVSACGCDMMSDALAFMKEQSVLLTGLVNPQVVRTAEMMDVSCVVFVRGKGPTDAMIELAVERNLILMSTGYRMFPACGILYSKGLSGGGKV